MLPIWVVFYHDLLGVVILLTVSYWALTQRDRINKRYSDIRAELEETEERLGQLLKEITDLRRDNARLRRRQQESSVMQAELEMLERFKRGDGTGAGVTINAHEVTIGGDVAGRDMVD